MSGIRNKNTQPEITIRKALFKQGFRYRLHDKRLAGKPDIVLPRYRAVIFVHGCFWHGHPCHLFKIPKTRTAFWKEKIEKNRANDMQAIADLQASDWRIAVVWECALKGRTKWPFTILIDTIATWVRNDDPWLEISGNDPAKDADHEIHDEGTNFN